MALFEIKNMTFTYPEVKDAVLKNINLSINKGDFIVVFGESGSGKTTLLKMLKRELTPHGKVTGDIYYKNAKITDISDHEAASEIGYVMQNPEAQIVTDKVWHELAFGLENIGIPTETIRRRVGEIANFFGIHHLFRENTADLSGGQKQLLNLAAVMVMQPEVLILDEPTSQLDPIAATNFINTLTMLNRELGTTIIIVEHRLEEVLPLADEVVLLEAGEILLIDRPAMIGQRLNDLESHHRMSLALPTATQVYHRLGFTGESPLTVRDGKQFLTEHFVKDDKHVSETSILKDEITMELKGAWFRYQKNSPDILADVDLTVYKGEILSILGGNGSGKTTLINVMSGQERAYRGVVKINGKKIQKYKGSQLYKHNLAVLPQDPQTVFLKSTVKEDYAEIAKVLNYSKDEMEKYIEQIARKLAVTHLLDSHPYDLSGGEQQKVALGKTLLLKPKILLLDEPTKGIDAFSKENLAKIIKELKDEGLTVVIVTHDVEFAATVSDRCGLFFDREMISLQTPNQFFSENNFYTTAASRMSRHLFSRTVTVEQIIHLCKEQQHE